MLHTLRPGDPPYQFPFHPLDLGEAALRAFFGFILEGRHHSDDLDPFEVPLHDSASSIQPVESNGNKAMLALARQMRLQRFKMNDDGTLTQIEGP